jgi:hypothetical protein
MGSDSSIFFKCPYCPCIFVSQHDLDLHLKAFGDYAHRDLWYSVHVVLEADEHNVFVDEHGSWHWSRRKSVHHSRVRKCRRILEEHGFVL